MTTSSRVIKNTIFLYVRMAVSIIVALYSTRLILFALGAVDFGIFNVIGGSIAMLYFLNSTMANTTQRFMSCALGEGIHTNQIKVFNVTVILHLGIGLITVLILIAVMPLLFESVLNIEHNRIFAAKIIYYCLIFSTFLTIINVPYEAVINAHEDMGYYTIIGFMESFLRLGIAFICIRALGDRLIIYGICMAILPLITMSIMKVYCHKKYPECIISLKKYFDFSIIRDIASFSIWNFLTAITHIATLQGMGLVLNHFFGSVLNAAQGIANQVNGQLSAFSLNMMKAINPVITKKTAIGDIESMNYYSLTGCKYSCYLFMFVGIPIAINIDIILKLWLKDVPVWTAVFCIFQLIFTLIVQFTNGIATAIYAIGRIKWYAIFKSIMNVIPIVLIYLSFAIGGSPLWLYIPVILILGIGGNCVIIYYANKECELSIKSYADYVIKPVIMTLILMLSAGSLVFFVSLSEIWQIIVSGIFTSIAMMVAMYGFGMSDEEKSIIKSLITNRLLHRQNRI